MRGGKPTPPPKVPALVRRSMAAAALGLGVGGAACGGAEHDPPLKDSGARASTSHEAGTSEASAETGSGQSVSADDAAMQQDAGQDVGQDAGQDATADTGRLPPPVPPLPPLPPALPPQ